MGWMSFAKSTAAVEAGGSLAASVSAAVTVDRATIRTPAARESRMTRFVEAICGQRTILLRRPCFIQNGMKRHQPVICQQRILASRNPYRAASKVRRRPCLIDE